jgi:hypothetical protein
MYGNPRRPQVLTAREMIGRKRLRGLADERQRMPEPDVRVVSQPSQLIGFGGGFAEAINGA